jgi:hypothetical protein
MSDSVFHFHTESDMTKRIDEEHGTAFWISKKRALTANHIFRNAGVEGNRCKVSYYKSGGGKESGLDCTIVDCRGHPYDMAVIELESDDNIEVAQVDWFMRPKAWWESCKRFSIHGFPLDRVGNAVKMDDCSSPRLTFLTIATGDAPNGRAFRSVEMKYENRRGHSEFDALSGGSLCDDNQVIIGMVSRSVHGEGNDVIFSCIETVRLAEWWPPLKNAVDAYKDGEKYLREAVEAYKKGEEYSGEEWGEAIEKLNESKSRFEEARVFVPEALEQMIAIAKAEQLLPERRWRDVKELIKKWQ